MEEIKNYDFAAVIVENKETGQKILTIPKAVREKYPVGRKVKVRLDFFPKEKISNPPSFPLENGKE